MKIIILHFKSPKCSHSSESLSLGINSSLDPQSWWSNLVRFCFLTSCLLNIINLHFKSPNAPNSMKSLPIRAILLTTTKAIVVKPYYIIFFNFLPNWSWLDWADSEQWYCQLRARRALSLALTLSNDVFLRIRRAPLLYKCHGNSTLLVLNGTSLNRVNVLLALAPFWFSMEHSWTALMPFWLSTDNMF